MGFLALGHPWRWMPAYTMLQGNTDKGAQNTGWRAAVSVKGGLLRGVGAEMVERSEARPRPSRQDLWSLWFSNESLQCSPCPANTLRWNRIAIFQGHAIKPCQKADTLRLKSIAWVKCIAQFPFHMPHSCA